MESLSVDRSVASTIEKLRAQLFDKGARGLHGLARAFRIADFDGSRALDRDEFDEALRFAGLFLSLPEISALFKRFDSSGDGSVNFEEFLSALRGDLNERRRKMVEKVFMQLDRDGSGAIEVADMTGVFSAKDHPEVQAGRATEEDVFKAFLGNFEGERKDGRVTLDEFTDYYTDIGASIPDDDYFIELLESCYCCSESAASAADVEKVKRYEGLLLEKIRQKRDAAQNPAASLVKVFKFFDTDRTGSVTIDEMTAALSSLGLPLHRRDVMLFFKLYDKDGSNNITYAEFVDAICKDA